MPKRVRGPNVLARDLREIIIQSFHKLGGRDYLCRIARTDPKAYLALVGKIIPSEVNVAVKASYEALQIPVEAREALPGEFVDVTPAALSAPQDDDDWLAAPVSPSATQGNDRLLSVTQTLEAG